MGGARRINSGYPVRGKDFSKRGFKWECRECFERFRGFAWGYGLGEIHAEGKSIVDFSSAFDLIIANTCFRKKDEHFITYKSGVSCSQIDFFLFRNSDRKICLDCKVIPRESLTSQHRVMVMDVRVKRRAKRRSHSGAPRIKWWHLKGEKQRIFQHKILEATTWKRK